MIHVPIGVENNPHNQKMLGDILKVFTVAVVRELIISNISNTKAFTDKWVNITLASLFVLFIYYMFVSHYVKFNLRNKVQRQESN